MPLGRGGHLVEDGQCVAHGAVGLLGDDVERGGLGLDIFLLTDVLQLLHDVGHGDAGKIIDLATRQDGGNHLLLLGGGKDEDGIFGRFLQRLEEGIEGRLRQHVHLIDDDYAVTPRLRRDAHLLGQVADVVHAVVRRAIQLIDVVGALLVERLARRALVAGFAVGCGVLAVDGLGKNAGTGRLAHAARAAKEVGMRQPSAGDGRLQRVCQRLLAHHAAKRRWPVLTRRNDILVTHRITK